MKLIVKIPLFFFGWLFVLYYTFVFLFEHIEVKPEEGTVVASVFLALIATIINCVNLKEIFK